MSFWGGVITIVIYSVEFARRSWMYIAFAYVSSLFFQHLYVGNLLSSVDMNNIVLHCSSNLSLSNHLLYKELSLETRLCKLSFLLF